MLRNIISSICRTQSNAGFANIFVNSGKILSNKIFVILVMKFVFLSLQLEHYIQALVWDLMVIWRLETKSNHSS